MTKNIFSRIATAINRLVDIASTGRVDRTVLLKDLNNAFKDGYINGDLEHFCSITTDNGVPAFKHELSHFLRSGIKLTINNDRRLAKSEVIEYGKCVTGDVRFIRKLMVLGYDTLVLYPKNHVGDFKYLQISLKKFVDLNNYMIEK